MDTTNKMQLGIIVLNATRYDFNTEDGNNLKGTKVRYLTTDSLKPVQDIANNVLGFQVAEQTFDFNYFNELQKVGLPFTGIGYFEMRNQKGSIKLGLADIDLKNAVHFD